MSQLAWKAEFNGAKANAYLILKLWESREKGGEGIGLLDFWSDVYWPTQKGLTRRQKDRQVDAFAPALREVDEFQLHGRLQVHGHLLRGPAGNQGQALQAESVAQAGGQLQGHRHDRGRDREPGHALFFSVGGSHHGRK